jgi:hypothetical protein
MELVYILGSFLFISHDVNFSEHKKEILVSFSMFTNGSKLLATKSSEGTLTCLHGIRFLSICWIVVGHRYMFSLGEPSINALDGYDVSSFYQVEEDLDYIRVCEFWTDRGVHNVQCCGNVNN